MSKKLPKITIAIDGYSSTGKSTVAKALAKELGYIYVDTGAMYRAVTLYAMEKKYITEDKLDKESLISDLKNVKLSFKKNKQTGVADIYLNNENVEEQIRSMKVSGFVSRIAEIPEVRKYLVDLQREMGKNKGVVMDGRDIGSVVFPDAELKIFLTADADVRAERRFLEMKEQGKDVSFKKIYNNVIERDRIDTTREDSPLVKVDDAIEIDVSNIDKKTQFNTILSLAHKAIIEARK